VSLMNASERHARSNAQAAKALVGVHVGHVQRRTQIPNSTARNRTAV
jgi:hypothetical protein